MNVKTLWAEKFILAWQNGVTVKHIGAVYCNFTCTYPSSPKQSFPPNELSIGFPIKNRNFLRFSVNFRVSLWVPVSLLYTCGAECCRIYSERVNTTRRRRYSAEQTTTATQR